MCKLTILHYTQCHCIARDGSTEEGFIVTKAWHNRLLIDLEAVPFERCTQAKGFALSSSRSNTMEFPRCHNVQVKTIRFEGEVCYRCLTHRRLLEYTDKIKALGEERKVFRDRYAALEKTESKDAEFTRSMRQTIKESPQFDKRIEKQKFFSTKADLRSTMFGSVKGIMGNWEDCLHQQLACRDLEKKKGAELKAGEAFGEGDEQEMQKKQSRLVAFHRRLVQVNKRAVSPVREDEEKPPSHEEMEENLRDQMERPRRLRIARPVRNNPSKIGSTLDVTVPVQVMQNMHGASSVQNVFATAEISSSDAITAHSLGVSSANNTVIRYHTINGGTAVNTNSGNEDAPVAVASPPAIKSASLRGLTASNAEAPEFRPFQRPPPTEPRMMRIPTAPRAMREHSLGRTTWQPRQQFATYRGYPTYRGWRG